MPIPFPATLWSGAASPFSGLVSATNLVAYWKLDESSNVTRVDSSTNGNNLTDTNSSVAAAAGKINNGISCGAVSTQYLNHASSASFNVNGTDFAFSGWVKLTDKLGTYGVFGEDNGSSLRCFLLRYESAADRFVWYVGDGSNSLTALNADSFGSPTAGVFYFFYCDFNSSTNVMRISINNGTLNTSAAIASNPGNGCPFALGCQQTNGNIPWNGMIDEVGFWKRRLSGTDITNLYNGGNGLSY